MDERDGLNRLSEAIVVDLFQFAYGKGISFLHSVLEEFLFVAAELDYYILLQLSCIN